MYIMKKVIGRLIRLVNSEVTFSNISKCSMYRKLYDEEEKLLHDRLIRLGWDGEYLINRASPYDELPTISELKYLRRKGVGYVIISNTWLEINAVLNSLRTKKPILQT